MQGSKQSREGFQGSKQRGNGVPNIKTAQDLGYAANTKKLGLEQSIESGKEGLSLSGFQAKQIRMPGCRAEREHTSKHKTSSGFGLCSLYM